MGGMLSNWAPEECANENDLARGGFAETIQGKLYGIRTLFHRFWFYSKPDGELESGKEFSGPTYSHENPNRANWKHSEARGAD